MTEQKTLLMPENNQRLSPEDQILADVFWYDASGVIIGKGDLSHLNIKNIRESISERNWIIASKAKPSPKAGYLLVVPSKSYWVLDDYSKATIAFGDVFMRVIDSTRAKELMQKKK